MHGFRIKASNNAWGTPLNPCGRGQPIPRPLGRVSHGQLNKVKTVMVKVKCRKLAGRHRHAVTVEALICRQSGQGC